MVGVIVAGVIAVAGLTHVILFPDEGRPDLAVDETADGAADEPQPDAAPETAEASSAAESSEPTSAESETGEPTSGGEPQQQAAAPPTASESASEATEATEATDESAERSDAAESDESGADRTAATAADRAEPPASEQSEASAPERSGESESDTRGAEVAEPPEFDIVRVGEDGITVIAGRAQPGATVTVFDGDKMLGSAVADARGEWVVVPTDTMKPGDHRINATATLGDGAAVPSRDEVVLVVPEPSKDIAGAATEQTGESLALLVPREGEGATTVLQAPAAPDAEAGEASDEAAEPTAAAETPTSGSAPAETEETAGRTDSGGDETAAAESEEAAAEPTTAPEAASVDVADEASDADKAGKEPAPLSLDVVDYDEQGRVVLSGRAETGSTVKGVLSGETIGVAEEADSGEWTLSPDSPVAPGRYTLVLQQLDPGGNIVDQISVPFERAAVPELPLDTNVVVQPGNSLWRIARRTYGDGVRYTVIYNANRGQIRDPDLIYPGQILELPEPAATN